MRVKFLYKDARSPKVFFKVKYIAELLDGYRILLEDNVKSYTVLKDEMDKMEITVDEK